MIDIFKYEIDDGLQDIISFNSIAYTTDIQHSNLIDTESFNINQAVANLLEKQPDLYYIKCILATLGWNLNDDIFLREEVVKAKNTPIDKPFNRMHNQDEIIGHMTSSRLLDSDYQVANEDKFEHIAVNSVIYKAWRDLAKKEEILKTIAEIEDGKWKVSMECLFSKFDYGIITAEGKQIIVERTPDTSYLTKHLRAYKGSGTYQGNKIGRVLRNITFCGKGLVDNPGNPYSIIFNSNKKFFGAIASINDFKENVMNELEKAQFEQAKAELASAQAALAEFKAKSVEQAEAALKSAIAERDAQIATLRNDLVTVTTNLSSAQASLTAAEAVKLEVVTNLEKAVAELTAIKAEATLAERKAAVAGVVAADRVESVLASVVNLPEDAFKSFISTLAEFKPFVKKEDEKKEEKKEDSKSKECMSEKTEADLAKAELDKDLYNTEAGNKVKEDFVAVTQFLKNSFKI